MISNKDYVGSWISALPFDSDDYLVRYDISLQRNRIVVKATDLQDGEQMKISDVKYHDGVVEFISYMPSTGRKGLNKFKLINKKRIEAEFTFTVIEELQKLEKTADKSRTGTKGK